MYKFKFPQGFLWGTATSAHQIEGNNFNSDWWEYEQNKPPGQMYPREPSLDGCDSYNKYEEDFELCKKMNNNAVRISIEWARIEPYKGQFDQEQLDHYKKMLKAAKDKGLKTFVTLHHFTNPIWFARKKGWANLFSPGYFAKYAKKCAEELDEYVDVYLTINEPQVYTMMGYVLGLWPPARVSIPDSLMVQVNFIKAHIKAYKEIKKVSDKEVGIVKNIVWYEVADDSKMKFLDSIFVKVTYWLNSHFILSPVKKNMDVIGLNYYFTNRIRHFKRANLDDRQTDLNWWVKPDGLYNVLKSLKKYNKPIYITENGLADAWDTQRIGFIRDMLYSAARAIKEGVDLKGYFHWSLLDNFEWHEGFWPKFGIVEVKRWENQKRVPRPSFEYYSDISKNNQVEFDQQV
jgi:beta-glucosidase